MPMLRHAVLRRKVPRARALRTEQERLQRRKRHHLGAVIHMEATDALRQSFWQVGRHDAEATSRRTRVIEQGLYLRIFRIDAQSDLHGFLVISIVFHNQWVEPLVLTEGVERKALTASQDLLELSLGISR